MSGYHSTELCYLAAVYTNLLITKQPLDFYFKPQPRSASRTAIAARVARHPAARQRPDWRGWRSTTSRTRTSTPRDDR